MSHKKKSYTTMKYFVLLNVRHDTQLSLSLTFYFDEWPYTTSPFQLTPLWRRVLAPSTNQSSFYADTSALSFAGLK